MWSMAVVLWIQAPQIEMSYLEPLAEILSKSQEIALLLKWDVISATIEVSF